MREEGGRQEAGSRGGELCREEGGRGREGGEEACVDDDAGDSGGLTDCSSFFFSLSVTEMLH